MATYKLTVEPPWYPSKNLSYTHSISLVHVSVCACVHVCQTPLEFSAESDQIIADIIKMQNNYHGKQSLKEISIKRNYDGGKNK